MIFSGNIIFGTVFANGLCMKYLICFLLCSFSVFGEGVQKCQSIVTTVESCEHLPKGLLSAIVAVESSSMPWVIGVRGVSYRYHTKEEAESKINELIASGDRNFDIGCAQINYHHHKHQFKSIKEMLDPDINIRYAAKFLKQLFSESGNWNKAIAYYNSRDLSVSGAYMAKVQKAWHPSIQNNALSWSGGEKLTSKTPVPVIVSSRINQAKVAYAHYKRTVTFSKKTS